MAHHINIHDNKRHFSLWTIVLVVLTSSCGTNLPPSEENNRHISEASVDSASPPSDIPSIVAPVPLVTPPAPQVEPELYTVVAQDVPIRDLLFSMARDAGINIDVHPDVQGNISINAIEQTLPQILERIARQSDIRWSMDSSSNMVVEPDSVYWKNYQVDYVNVARNSTTAADVSTAISSGVGAEGEAAGNNNSSTNLTQNSANNFWPTLSANLSNLLGEASASGAGSSSVVANPESGVISVRATSRQQAEVASFLESVQERSLYQVLIEATVVEVDLNDRYQAGVDWQTISLSSGGVSFAQNLTPPDLDIGIPPASVLTLNRSSDPGDLSAVITLLSQFGNSRVLSSPKIMALNNQTAMLRVVDNTVYFTVDVQAGTQETALSPAIQPTYTTTVHTVPVGFVMTVTPQVGDDDQVTLNVRPTISRIVRYVTDPSPALAQNDVVNEIPEVQVREMESILKVFSGQVAILGGLMQDSLNTGVDGVPYLSRLPGIGGLFSYTDERASKTELIIFIRPIVIKQA
ncbi:MAG: pilus (MSHA type) biogenesis protein MshL, partial [Pseudomonadota bacterium]